MTARTCAAPDCDISLEGCHGKRKWCSDRCRKRTLYSGECVDCGRRTEGIASGLERESKRCRGCSTRHARKVAREGYIESIREWAELYGEPPTAADWHIAPSQLAKMHPDRRREALARHSNGRSWPYSSGVVQFFGSWNAALLAAGFTPLSPGSRRDPDAWLEHRWGEKTAA